MARQLKATPSCPEDLTACQRSLMDDATQLHKDLQSKRSSFLSIAMAYTPDPRSALQDIAKVKEQVSGITNEDAMAYATSLLKPGEPKTLGLLHTSVFHWMYTEESFWRGVPDNKRVLRLAKSMIASSFRADSPISSRTLDLSAKEGDEGILCFRLLFGDGSARGLAAWVVWMLILRRLQELPTKDPAMEKLLHSILNIPTNFELHGDGSKQALLLAQAARQNQHAQVLPVDTMQWIGLIRDFTGVPLGGPLIGTKGRLVQILETMMAAYNSLPEVEAYSVEPAAKRQRSRRGKKPAGDQVEATEGRDKDLKIGNRRLQAMRLFLNGATEESFKLLRAHLIWAADFRYSVLSDEILGTPWFYVDSHLPPEHLPKEQDILIRDAGSQAAEQLIQPGYSKLPLYHDTPLTVEQFDLMIQKAVRVFEDDTAHLEREDSRLRFRPSVDQWVSTRRVIQRWTESIRECAKADLSEGDFTLLQATILDGDALDATVLSLLNRYPKTFHIGLLPEIEADYKPSFDESAMALRTKQTKAWSAKCDVFIAELAMDWELLQNTHRGCHSLCEILRWTELDHKRQQATVGKELVEQRMKKCFPMLRLNAWDLLAANMSVLIQEFERERGVLQGTRRCVALLDFNAPGSRDALKLPQMLNSLATLMTVLGQDNCVLYAWMANHPKEDSDVPVDEDEQICANLMRRAGFSEQVRIRMSFDMPESVAKKLSNQDWWGDARLAFIPGPKANFWQLRSELTRKRRVDAIPSLPLPKDFVEVSTMNADEDINSGERRHDAAERHAQRGPNVAESQLAAILTKSAFNDGVLSEWLEPKDELIVLDLTPHVGDRALGTLKFTKTSASEALGLIRHVIVSVGARGHGPKAAAFTEARVQHKIAREWMDRTLVLHETRFSANGFVTEHPVHPNDSVPPPSEEVLQSIPGVLAAWRGLSKLEFKVCEVQASKVVIQPQRLSEFQGAPVPVSEEIERCRAHHVDQFQDLLSHMATSVDLQGKPKGEQEATLQDGRTLPAILDVANALSEFDSEEKLKSIAKITCEVKALGDKGLMVLFDEAASTVYFLAQAADMVLTEGFLVGGFGGGHVLPRTTDHPKAVPWSLPSGDKTWVQLARVGDNAEGGGEQQAKFTSGTLYSVVRELEARFPGRLIKLTSFGELRPTGTAGRHSYTLEFPEDSPQHQARDFVPSSHHKEGRHTIAANAFTPLAHPKGIGEGILKVAWRLTFDPVGAVLKCHKPHIVVGRRVELRRGRPAKVLWGAA